MAVLKYKENGVWKNLSFVATEGGTVDLTEYAKTADIEGTYVKQDDILDMMYPVGSVYVTNTNSEPTIGGSWDLINQHYAYKYMDEGFFTFNTSNVTGGSIYAVIQGDIIKMRIDFKPLTAWDDNTIEIGTIDLAAIGTTGFSLTQHALALSDGGQGYCYCTVNPTTGVINCYDTIAVDGGDTITANQTFSLELIYNVLDSRKIDSFCDRFYWTRTA